MHVIADRDAEGPEEAVVRPIARHRHHPVVRDLLDACWRAQHDRRLPDRVDRRIEVRADAAFLDPVLEIGLDPVLDLVRQRRPPHDERHVGSVTVTVERRLCGRVLGADDRDLLPDVAVWLGVVMRDLREVLAWHVQPVRHIEEADRDDHVAAGVLPLVSEDRECRLRAADLEHAFVQPDGNSFTRRYAAVVLDRLFPRGFVTLHGERMSADLDQLGGREELHPGGIAHDGIDQGALVDDERGEALAPGFDRAGEPDRSGADHDDVVHVVLLLFGSAGALRPRPYAVRPGRLRPAG